jgi:hypothetical protein
MDGSSEQIRIPAEIWRYNNFNVSKLIATKKEAKAIVLDPNLETADADLENNFFPRRTVPTRFQTFKSGQRGNVQPEPDSPLSNQTSSLNTSANLSGKWNIAIDAGGQTVSLSLDLAQAGNNVTGTILSSNTPESFSISSGNVQNGILTLKTIAPTSLTLVGNVSGNTINGNLTNPRGTGSFNGTKVP